MINARFEQIVGVAPVEGAGQDFELRKVFAHGVDEFQRLFGAVQCQDDEPGVSCAGGFQQIVARGIAVVDLQPEAAQQVHAIRVVVEHGGVDAVGAEQAAYGGAEAAEAGDEHGAFLFDGVGLTLHFRRADTRLQEAFVEHDQQWCQCHGERHCRHQRAGDFGREYTFLVGE